MKVEICIGDSWRPETDDTRRKYINIFIGCRGSNRIVDDVKQDDFPNMRESRILIQSWIQVTSTP